MRFSMYLVPISDPLSFINCFYYNAIIDSILMCVASSLLSSMTYTTISSFSHTLVVVQLTLYSTCICIQLSFSHKTTVSYLVFILITSILCALLLQYSPNNMLDILILLLASTNSQFPSFSKHQTDQKHT